MVENPTLSRENILKQDSFTALDQQSSVFGIDMIAKKRNTLDDLNVAESGRSMKYTGTSPVPLNRNLESIQNVQPLPNSYQPWDEKLSRSHEIKVNTKDTSMENALGIEAEYCYQNLRSNSMYVTQDTQPHNAAVLHISQNEASFSDGGNVSATESNFLAEGSKLDWQPNGIKHNNIGRKEVAAKTLVERDWAEPQFPESTTDKFSSSSGTEVKMSKQGLMSDDSTQPSTVSCAPTQRSQRDEITATIKLRRIDSTESFNQQQQRFAELSKETPPPNSSQGTILSTAYTQKNKYRCASQEPRYRTNFSQPILKRVAALSCVSSRTLRDPFYSPTMCDDEDVRGRRTQRLSSKSPSRARRKQRPKSVDDRTKRIRNPKLAQKFGRLLKGYDNRRPEYG